jgi:hypothetical protein
LHLLNSPRNCIIAVSAAAAALPGMGLVALDAAIAAAEQRLPLQGWPVAAGRLMRRCIATASRAATYPDFAFLELIK